MHSIFSYADFKVFLKDLLEDRSSKGNPLTYEKLGKRIGFTSKGFVTQIIHGKSKIPVKKIGAFGKALGLKKKERDYFEILVLYSQAKTSIQKNLLFRMLTKEFKTRIEHIGPDKYEFYATWYYSAVRSLLSYYPFAGDYKKLAGKLVPAITPGQAQKAIQLLEKLALIRKREDGFYHVTDRLITTGDTVEAFAVANYQKATMDLAKDSLDRFEKPDRSSATLTLGLSEAGYKAIKEKLDVVRREIMEIANYDKQIDRVIQINMHAFPLTKKNRGLL